MPDDRQYIRVVSHEEQVARGFLECLSAELHPDGSEAQQQQQQRILLSNKYYTAQVDVVIDVTTADAAADTREPLSGKYEQAETASSCGAIAVAGYGSDLAPLLSSAAAAASDDDVRLCVAVYDARTRDEAWERASLMACVERQFEFCCVVPDSGDDGAREAYREEGQGITRVVEALNAHVWPLMKRSDAGPGARSEVAPSADSPRVETLEEGDRLMERMQDLLQGASKLSQEQRVEKASELMEELMQVMGISDSDGSDNES